MNKSESISKIATALVAAQKSIGAAEKGKENPFFKSRYADLGSVMAVCKEPLLSQGITPIQIPGYDADGSPTLETILLHSSGEFISSTMKVAVTKQNDPQSYGSGLTYAKRHAMQAMAFIPSVDDDAEWAAHAEQQRPTPEQAAENLKEAITSRGGEIIEPPAPKEPGKWQDVEIHVGKANGPMLGKKLGEVPTKVFDWLVEKWLPKAGKADKDRELAKAIMQAQIDKAKDDNIPGLETPASASEPEKAADTPPAAETKQEPQKPTKAPPAEKPVDWKSVKIHFGSKGSPILGKTLGEISPDHRLACYIFGVPRIVTDTPEDRAFKAAVEAMNRELRFDQVPDTVNRRKVVEMATAITGPDAKALDAALIEGGVIEKGETFVKCSAEMVAHILKNWSAVAEILKGSK